MLIMKVLVLTNFGMGLYKFRKELLREFINRGYDVTVSLPDDEYIPKIKEIGCKYIETKVDRRGINPFTDIGLFFSYIGIIKSIKPDIVLTYTIKPNVYGGMACRITGTPYIPNITGLGTAVEGKGLVQKIALCLYRAGLKNAKCVFFQNETNRRLFIKKGIVKNNTELIPGSGVNLGQHCFEEYPEDDGNIRFLYIGRIMKDKGIDELLAAAKIIKEKHNNVTFDIIGFCEEGYNEALNELSGAGIISFHGQQDDVHRFIKNSHATILPSYHEGMSNALLESAATGRPVLASNVPGCIETFDDGVSGFGFEARSVDSLVNAINKFIELPYEAKRQMGLAGRSKTEREFDRKVIIDSYLKQING